jgi:tetratricopeptide (TPR) repeat protein
MNARLIATVIALFLVLAAGCTGPTKTGIEAREQATERMEFVHAQMAYDQAKQSFSTGQLDKALKLADSAIARLDNQAPYHVLRGRILLEQHALEESIRSFDRALELDPTIAEAEYFRGIVFERWSNHPQASEAYLAAWTLDDTNVQYLLASAEMLVTQGRYEDARNLVAPKLAYFEHNAALRQLLGQIAMLQGRPEDAATLLGEARLLNPEDNMLLEELARAQFASGQFAQAHYSVTQLQKLQGGERADLMHLEARCLVMLDRPSDARNIYLRLSQLIPADETVWIELGNVAFEVGDFRRLAVCSNQIIALAPSRFEGYLLRGLFEKHSDDNARAIEAFRKAAELAPADVAWPHLLLGMSLEEHGKSDEAIAAYGAAVRAEPDNDEAIRRLQQMSSRAIASEPVTRE